MAGGRTEAQVGWPWGSVRAARAAGQVEALDLNLHVASMRSADRAASVGDPALGDLLHLELEVRVVLVGRNVGGRELDPAARLQPDDDVGPGAVAVPAPLEVDPPDVGPAAGPAPEQG